MNNKINVLHINSYYFAGKFYKNLYDKQVEEGLNISVYVPLEKRSIDSQFDYGKYTTLSRCYNEVDRLFFYLKYKKVFNDLIKKEKVGSFDLVHAHSLFANGSVAYKLKKKYGIPYIVAVRNTDVNTFFRYFFYLKTFGIKILLNADKVIFISKTYQELVINHYVPKRLRKIISDKSLVISNGIDSFWLKNRNTNRKQPTEVIKFLQVGDINKNKNITTSLKAIEHLNDKGINCFLTAIGKVKNNRVFKKIKKSKYLEYFSPMPKNELIKYYRRSHIFILPSHHETFGLVYPEAMSQGLPLIYSKGQGFDKQFNEGEVGFGVNSKSYIDIVSSVEKILNKYNYISDFALKNAFMYDWKLISLKITEVYKQISDLRN